MVECVDQINRPVQRLYYPPYPSKYNPIERCWGFLKQHGNGSKLVDIEAMLSWASSMTQERAASNFDFKQHGLPKRDFSE